MKYERLFISSIRYISSYRTALIITNFHVKIVQSHQDYEKTQMVVWE